MHLLGTYLAARAIASPWRFSKISIIDHFVYRAHFSRIKWRRGGCIRATPRPTSRLCFCEATTPPPPPTGAPGKLGEGCSHALPRGWLNGGGVCCRRRRFDANSFYLSLSQFFWEVAFFGGQWKSGAVGVIASAVCLCFDKKLMFLSYIYWFNESYKDAAFSLNFSRWCGKLRKCTTRLWDNSCFHRHWKLNFKLVNDSSDIIIGTHFSLCRHQSSKTHYYEFLELNCSSTFVWS